MCSSGGEAGAVQEAEAVPGSGFGGGAGRGSDLWERIWGRRGSSVSPSGLGWEPGARGELLFGSAFGVTAGL